MPRPEDIILDLQSGIRRWVIIVFGICIAMSFPAYLVGTQLSQFYFYNASWNTSRFNNKSIVQSKTINEKPVTLETSDFVDLINGKRLLYSFLNNRLNTTIGYDQFVYKLQVLDREGSVISDETRSTYILPGEAKYISAYSDNPDAVSLSILRLEDTKLVEYNSQASEFLRPIELEIREQIVINKDKNTLTLKINLKNPTKFVVKDVDLVMLVRDGQDSVVGVQDYKVSGLVPNDNREVKIDYPKPKNRTAKTLDTRYSVNYLDVNGIKLR